MHSSYMQNVVAGYGDLADILSAALDQAQGGKGAERHGTGQPFRCQPMQKVADLMGPAYLTGQAAKKVQEAQRMDDADAEREILGAIVYLAGYIIYRRRHQKTARYPGVTESEVCD